MKTQDIFRSSLRLINVLGQGEPLDPDLANDVMQIANDMIDAWTAERYMIYAITRTAFPLSVLKQIYTLGVGGDFNIPRPPKIERMSYTNDISNPMPIELNIDMVDEAGWQSIPVKNTQGTLPKFCWDDKQYPRRNLSLWPIPTVPISIILYFWATLTGFADLNTTDYTFPPAYAKAIRYNLAVDLAPELEVALRPEVAMQAIETKALIKSMNMEFPELSCDEALIAGGGTYNWLTDGTGRGNK